MCFLEIESAKIRALENSLKFHCDKGGEVSPQSHSKCTDEVSIPQRTVALCRGLYLVLYHHRCPVEIRDEMLDQVSSYLDDCLNEKMWLKRCKYLLTYPLAQYLRNDLPPPPDRSFKPVGRLRKWMQSRRFFNRKNSHLWYSWFQAKRSTLSLSESVVADAYADHLKILTSPDPGVDEVIDSIFSNTTFNNVLHHLRKKVNKSFSESPSFHKFYPSASACFEATRKQGGQHGFLSCQVDLSTPAAHIDNSELSSMCYIHKNYVTGQGSVIEKRVKYGRDSWDLLPNLIQKLDTSRTLNCTIQAVLEPNKVRIISKGEAEYYYSQRPLQRAMHDAMRDMPPFRLIGRPFSPVDILDISKNRGPRDEWFSIDYSAATDGLSFKYSGRIFEMIIRDLPENSKLLARQVLGFHNLYYPNLDENKAELVNGILQPVPIGAPVFKGVQKNGQLMGSVLSFPILCLANLGVYLHNMADHQKHWTHDQRLNHVLINGDDMVYCAPPEFWKTHIKIGESVGLKMSVGKAYVHETYLNINSTSVHCPLRTAQPHPWQINYLNSGLFFGQHKIQTDRKDSVIETDDNVIRSPTYAAEHSRLKAGITENINWLLSGTVTGGQNSLLRLLLQFKKDEIRHECLSTIDSHHGSIHTRNLFLPKHFGGMGVVPPVDWRFKVSTTSKKIANQLVGDQKYSDTQFPLRGYEVVEVDCNDPSPWARVVKEETMPVFSDKGWFSFNKRRLQLGHNIYSGLPNTFRLKGQRDSRQGWFATTIPPKMLSDSWSEYVFEPMAHYAEGINLHSVVSVGLAC